MTKQEALPETEFLHQVTVRLIFPEARDRFDELLEREPYLPSARLGGGKAFVMWPQPKGNGSL